MPLRVALQLLYLVLLNLNLLPQIVNLVVKILNLRMQLSDSELFEIIFALALLPGLFTILQPLTQYDNCSFQYPLRGLRLLHTVKIVRILKLIIGIYINRR